MKVKKYDSSGKQAGDIDLPDAMFSSEVISAAAMHEVLRAELRNRRQGTHKTKTVSEVSGGGKKPYRQKGTGNARQGSTRSTQFRGGATMFGPVPRDYTIKVTKKKRRAGLRSIFAGKANSSSLSVLTELKSDDFSTSKVFGVFKAMGLTEGKTRVAFVSEGGDEKLKRSFANLENITLIDANRLTAPELHHADHVVIAEAAISGLVETYKKSPRGAEAASA